MEFTQATLPSPFFLQFYHDQLPHLCNPHRGTFHQVHSVNSIKQKDSVIDIYARTQDDQDISIQLDFFEPSVFRLLMAPGKEAPTHSTPMLVEDQCSHPVPKLFQENHKVILKTSELELTLGLDPWSLEISDKRGRKVAKEFDDRGAVGHSFALKLGYLTDTKGYTRVFDSWYLKPDESIYGLGEQFAPIDRRGLTFYLWNVDTASTSSERAYKNVPFYMSSEGYGLFINTTSRATIQAGSVSHISLNYEVEDPILDFFFFHGPSFQRILKYYTNLTGRPPVLPRWSYGFWISRCSFHNQEEVMSIARRFRAENIPADLIHIDPDWMRPNHFCDLQWDTSSFPDPEKMFRELKTIGFKVSLWEQPYVPKGTERFQEGANKGYFVRKIDGQPYLFRDFMNNDVGVIDFTNPDAIRWFQERHHDLLKMGATVFKTDMGEAIPEDSIFFDGTSGRTTHNVYSLYYNQAAFETASAYSPETAIVWCRSAWAGSQRYPVHWGGDPTCRFEDMSTELWGGLGLGLSGFAYWSHDIGGFIGSPTPDLFIRWAQFGLLSSHARAHGSTPREPWEYGENALRIFREIVGLRYRLIPYLYSLSHTAHQTGLPLLRAMVLEFQDDLAVRRLGSQYMLGPSLLVAPVMDDSNRRDVYLPRGYWLDWWTKEIHEGPKTISMDIPLERIPLFLRQDSILPLGEVTQWVGEARQVRLELHIFIQEQASLTIYDEDDHPWQFHAQKTENQLVIDLPASHYEITLALYGEKPERILVDEVIPPADLLQESQLNNWILNVPSRSNKIIAEYS